MRRSDRRHHFGVRLHSVAALDASAGGWRLESSHARAGGQSRALDSGAATAGWRLQHLCQGAVGDQRHRQSLLRAQGGGPGGRRCAAGACARAHSGTRRHSGGQQLRQDQPQPVRHVSAAVLPLHPAGGHVSAGQFHLPDVGLDARHRRFARDCTLQQPAPPSTRRLQPGRALQARRQPRIPAQRGLLLMVQFLPGRGSFPEVLGKTRLARAAAEGSARGGAMDARALRELRRPGRHLSSHDVRHHGAGCTRLSSRSPRQPGGPLPVRTADDRRRQALPVPTVLLSDLGHGYRRIRGGPGQWDRRSFFVVCRLTRSPPSGGLDPLQRSPRFWRLVGEASENRAVRLGILFPQRSLPGYRRHGHDPAGAEPCGSDGRGGSKGMSSPRAQLDSGYAGQRWRLGGLRRRQQLGVPQRRPIRGPQRHARPGVPRYHRPRAGGFGRARPAQLPSGRKARRRFSTAQPAARWKLVRPLGRRLHLRHLLRAAGIARRALRRPRGPGPARRRMAAFHSERRRRLGRVLLQLRPRLLRAGRKHAIPNGVGLDGPDRRRRH